MERDLSAEFCRAGGRGVGVTLSSLGARGSTPIRASLGDPMSRGGESPTQGEIPRLFFDFERGKLRPFFLLLKEEILAVLPLFRLGKRFKRFFFETKISFAQMVLLFSRRTFVF